MKKRRAQKGFTLPEVIVSIGILVTVIAAATSVVVSVMRSNADNVDRIVAYGLAQEGIEAMRYIRDTNWELGIGLDGWVSDDGNERKPWGEKIYDDDQDESKLFLLQRVKNPVPCDDNLGECFPLKLEEWKEGDTTSNRIFKNDGNQYSQNDTSNFIIETKFSRYIKVTPIKQDSNRGDQGSEVNKLLIESVVEWGNADSPKRVVLTTELTDWKS